MSYSIKPFIRPDKGQKTSNKRPIYFQVRLDKTLMKIPTGKSIDPRYWDKASSKVKGGGNGTLLNAYLDKKVTEFNEFMLTNETLGKTITRQKVKEFFQRKSGRKTFYQLFEEQIKLWEGTKRWSTLQHYRYTLQIMKEYQPELPFEDVTFDFVERFDNYLRTKRGNSDNGVYGRHKNLKAIVKAAIRKGFMTRCPYDDFRIKSAIGTRNFLESSEVKKLLMTTTYGMNPTLQDVKEMFLFACFTGLRFSDIAGLQWGNVNLTKRNIQLTMEKTSKPIAIPLIAPALAILEKRKAEKKELHMNVFEPYTNQFVNRTLKVLMATNGIAKKITFHCARHTFASNHVEANTHMMVLKDLLGHSNISQTEIYTKTLKTGLVLAMKNLETAYQIKSK